MNDPHPDLSPATCGPADGPLVGVKVVVGGEDPPECTLWDADVPDGELTTAWITAEGSAFVSLEEMR